MVSNSQPAPPLPRVDFGRAAADYARWRQGFPAEFFRRLDALGIGLEGQSVLDLGTGTGLLARAFAGRGCRVTGLDLSGPLLEAARKADRAAKVAIDYKIAPAEATGLPDRTFDLVSAATCWHWFDRPKAAAEARRLLKPGGRLLIADLDWHARPGNVIDATIQAIRRHSPARDQSTKDQSTKDPATKDLATKNVFQYPAWAGDLTSSGFDDWEAFAFTTQLSYSHEAWRGRIRASAGVGPVMDPDTLARFEEDLAGTLSADFPDDPLPVDHRVFALVAWRRGRDARGEGA